jgi:hypothetical protein
MPPRNQSGGSQAAAEATAELIAGYKPPVGLAAAVALMRNAFDEQAHVLWKAGGPRNSHTEEIGAILVEIGDNRRVILATGLQSGAFKLFAEVSGKTPEAMALELGLVFGVTPETKPQAEVQAEEPKNEPEA